MNAVRSFVTVEELILKGEEVPLVLALISLKPAPLFR
jgi:hypothetical protein